jgi:tetratricopeptide (TPR) repeat protein
VDEFAGEEVANDPARFTSLSSNNRSAWWGEAWDVFRADPVAGAGANTFEVARKRYRELASSVTQPHSVPLQFLAGTGLVGLLLLAGLVAAVAAAAVGAVRGSGGDERSASAALAVALALWLLHALVDYPWDFVAVTAPALFAAGALAATGRELVFLKHKLLAAGTAAAALAAIVSVATPWLAERSLRDVNPAIERRDLAAAKDAADRAASLDPLSLAPLFARARVAAAGGDAEAERAAHVEAVRLQPGNPEAWLALGLLEYDRGDWCSAYRDLNEAYTLDPAGLQWARGGPFDETKEWVNAGNCG